ncbi:hypothetical protein [Roseisalinus antarcticus]|uniref:Uncharacterized protein n=1 Tax=Roseisalinus antarcticus TaxID=254357 RepID=A0A1Y5TDN4_9RHOB|nr:hypothetical protein [Roseisalinus antarcticus]SLN61707.1 hypothetical protein ROA7023_02882 [Roseisalinus antarcticus]
MNGAPGIGAVEAQSDIFGETGILSLTHVLQTVSLQRSYDNPVVIAFVATENGMQPVNVRMRDVGADELTLQLQEPNFLNVWHTDETVNYLVVEAGTWIVPDGTLLEAGTIESNKTSSKGFEQITFDAEFDSAPVVLSQVQTFNGRDFVTTRQRDADADSFQLTMQEEESQNDRHVTETIGWLAMEQGSGTAGEVSWLAGRTSGVGDGNATVELGASLDGGANAIAMLTSFAGKDPAWARGNGSTNTSFELSAEEDTSGDPETDHVPETADYFVFDQAGALSAAPLRNVAETGTFALSDEVRVLTLQRSYENPVVIAFVATENAADPVDVRVSDVSGNQLTFQLQEPTSAGGGHADETVNYIVIEAGTWILPDGTILEAGTLESSQLSWQGFEPVTFDAEFDEAPVILSQVQTANDTAFVTTRQRDADADGFRLTMQEKEALNDTHATETIGWLAMEQGSGTAGDVGWQAGSTSGVGHLNATVDLGQGPAGGVNAIAMLSSFAGRDTAWVRGNGSTAMTFDVSVQEETSLDAEMWHTSETVDYFVFDQAGIIGAYDYDLLL